RFFPEYWDAAIAELAEFIPKAAANPVPKYEVPSIAPAPIATQPAAKATRNLEAAMPQQTKTGASTELWAKISLPSSEVLRAELPAIVPSGEVIQKEDTRSSSFPISFPRDPQTGELLPVTLCLEVKSQDFLVTIDETNETCADEQCEILLPPDADSRTV